MGYSKVLEKDLEKKLRIGVKNLGGMARKFVSPGWNGAPDRILLFPGALTIFVEMKKPGEDLEPLQEYRAKELSGMDFPVFRIRNAQELFQFLNIELPAILRDNRQRREMKK